MTSSEVPGLVDAFGRVAQDLRISLTDKCSLRCTYCMPAAGLEWLGRDQLLTDDEIVRLASVFVELGVHTIRLTGGEPLVRAGVPALGRRPHPTRPQARHHQVRLSGRNAGGAAGESRRPPRPTRRGSPVISSRSWSSS